MAVYEGADLLIEVESATPGVFVLLSDMTRYSSSNTRTTNRVPVFGGPAHEVSGERNKTFTLEGLWNDDDAGQLRVRAASENQTELKMRVLPDGVNGFECTVLVGTTGGEATADEATLQTFTVDAEMQGDETPIGTGVLV
jgi:hypothetical protein